MLEFDDIQYILLTRVPALTGRYEFLSFRQPAQGRAWLEAVRQKVPSAKAVFDTVDQKRRWASVAFTWNGLRALGLLVPCDGGKPTSRPEGASLTSSLECIGYESCTTREEQHGKNNKATAVKIASA